MAVIVRCLAALSLLTFSLALAQAQGNPSPLRVATRVVPPMVVQHDDHLSGFSIDLWNSIAERLNRKTDYRVAPDVGGLLEAVRDDKADLGVSAVSITSERESAFDFSQPIMNAGLQILVRGGGERAEPNLLADLMRLFFSRTILVWLGIALLLVLIPAHLIWLFERNHRNGIIPDGRYFPGIFHAMFWAAGTLATQADQMPRHWMSRIIAVLWMFTAVVFVAFYTAQLTATLTVRQIQGAINSPDDLTGRRVGTTHGSTSAAYLREHKALIQEFSLIDEAYAALLDKRVDAIVFDAPVLLYYSVHEGKGQVQAVGSVFHREDYGIVFPTNSPLRKQVNEVLLALREDGTYEKIYDKWFGNK